MVFLRAVNDTSAAEGNAITFEVVLRGYLEENLTVTFQLSFMDGTVNSKLAISGSDFFHIYTQLVIEHLNF